MEGQETTSEPEGSRALLWAIVDFREALDALVEEQKALLLGQGAEPPAAEPLPAAVAVAYAPPPTPPPPQATPAVVSPDPQPARKYAPPEPRPRARENPAPPTQSPAAEPAAPEPSRPEDARQRLDALAAKLLDRRMKQTAVDPPAHHGGG